MKKIVGSSVVLAQNKKMDKETIKMLLGFGEIEVESIELSKEKITIHCHSILEESLCPGCLEKCNKVKTQQVRLIRDMPISGKEVHLALKARQFHCEKCKRYFYEQFSFVEPRQQLTVRLEKYLYLCLKDSSFKQVAVRENILWDVLQQVFNRYAKKEVKKELNYIPKRIGIDEFSYKKGKKEYAVVIVDLDRGRVWDVLEERSKEYLKAYFQQKGDLFCQSIEVVSCDMWEGFSSTAKEVFPKAEVVIDRFHFFMHVNKVVDERRKQLRRKYPKQVAFKAIKWLLYKAWEKLSFKERSTLMKAFRLCPLLRQVYFIKNELQNIFNAQLTKSQAQGLVEQWVEGATQLKNEAMETFLKTLQSWKDDILNFFTHRVSNGMVEGINNGIKTLKRVAYGMRNFQHFRLRILVNFI